MGILIGLVLAMMPLLIGATGIDPTHAEKRRYVDEVSNDRKYDWYLDQVVTGQYAAVNCVPTALVMAGKWQNEYFDMTVKEAIETYKKNGGGWPKNELLYFLEKEEIIYSNDKYVSVSDMTQVLDEGHIIVVALNISDIESLDREKSSVGRYYRSPRLSYHCIILKGYVYLDSILYFESYDPYNAAEYYKDGEPKGKDRLYSASEIGKGVEEYWGRYFVIYDN